MTQSDPADRVTVKGEVGADLVRVSERILAFGHFLRLHEIPVDTTALLVAQRIALTSCLRERALFRSALRACFCKSAAQWQRFDSLFDDYWREPTESGEAIADPETPAGARGSIAGVQSLLGFGGASSQPLSTDQSGAGDYKVLSLADFRFVFDPAQMHAIECLIDRLARRARRTYLQREKTAAKGQRIDFGASIQHAMRTAAHVTQLRFRQRQRRLPRFVLLLDISQSMDTYAKLFLRYTREMLSIFEQSHAFAFNIELIPLGQGHRKLSETDVEYALNELPQGWLGGTKIAESLETFNRSYLRRVVNNKTTVLIFSDGCDTVPVVQLQAQVEIIQRCAKRLIWVNPLLGRFEPGEKDPKMDPLQPFIDAYHSAHNLETLRWLEDELLG